MNIPLLFALSTNLSDGLEVIAAVSIASTIFCPLFCWILTNPNTLIQRKHKLVPSPLRKLKPMLSHQTANEPKAA